MRLFWHLAFKSLPSLWAIWIIKKDNKTMNNNLTPPEIPENESPFDRELTAFMGRETFTDKMISSRKRRKNYGTNTFAHELQEYWFLYAFLAVSGLFTLMLGVFMGMSPKIMADGSIYFHTDGAHIFMAALYGLSFVTVTEFAFALGKRLFYLRESGNVFQAGTMLVMMAIAGISVFGTGIAGGVIVASTIDFMSEFVAVPAWAQYWVVRIIPGLIVGYSVLLTVYALSSSRAESERIIRDRQHAHDLDMEMRRKTLEQFAQEKVESAALKIYMRNIEDGTISVAEALAAARSGNVLDNIAAETKVKNRRPALPTAPVPSLVQNLFKRVYAPSKHSRLRLQAVANTAPVDTDLPNGQTGSEGAK